MAKGQQQNTSSGWGWVAAGMALLVVWGLLWVSNTVAAMFFHTGLISSSMFISTLVHWHTKVIWGTTRVLPHAGAWHVLVVALVVVMAFCGYLVGIVGYHFFKSKGSIFAFGSKSREVDKNSDDCAKWLPFEPRKFKDFTPSAITTRDRVRPSLAGVPTKERRVDDYGFILGYARGDVDNPVAISSEYSMLLAGEPRSGKTAGFVIPWVSSWQGPVLTTSTKNEVLRATLAARKRVSDHIYVLSLPGVNIPEGVESISYDICWFYEEELDALIESAERRASIFSTVAGDKSQPIWESATKQIFACLLLIGFAWRHAQVLYLGDDSNSAKPDLNRLKPETHHIDVLKSFATLEWTRYPVEIEAVKQFLITNIPNDKGAYVAAYVKSVVRTFEGKAGDTEFAQTIAGMISVGLGKLNDPQVAAVFSTQWNSPVFDPEEFLAESGTLYLISRSEDSGDLAKFFSLVCNEVAAAARRRAARMGRCDPGLAMILDEVANIAPLPNLKSYMSEGGGNGITTVAVVQSLRQLITTYGQVMAMDIVSSSNVIATFGGSKNKEDLDMFSFQAGSRTMQMNSYDKAGNITGRSDTIQSAIDSNQIANMPQGWMLVKLPNCDAIMVKTVYYWLRPKYKWGENPFTTWQWSKEWGEGFMPESRKYFFHDTSRALSYRAAYELAVESEKLRLTRLQVEIPPLFVNDADVNTDSPAESVDVDTKKKSEPADKRLKPSYSPNPNAADLSRAERRAKVLTDRAKLPPDEGVTWNPEDDGYGSLFG